MIFERTFESFRVLGAELEDQRMALSNGDVFDVVTLAYDLTGITDLPLEQIKP